MGPRFTANANPDCTLLDGTATDITAVRANTHHEDDMAMELLRPFECLEGLYDIRDDDTLSDTDSSLVGGSLNIERGTSASCIPLAAAAEIEQKRLCSINILIFKHVLGWMDPFQSHQEAVFTELGRNAAVVRSAWDDKMVGVIVEGETAKLLIYTKGGTFDIPGLIKPTPPPPPPPQTSYDRIKEDTIIPITRKRSSGTRTRRSEFWPRTKGLSAAAGELGEKMKRCKYRMEKILAKPSIEEGDGE
ncbi:hypothetical protein I316_04235 [Kwoniella heveanensis BCC8398]|uniref:Uncharacterized protein n=1 Tax=Kwoniella heveanensis BCC8398 TaxID=1296120 RepID=A0A1B9GS94_9TREE|nr:hypothetical protein I316_04235 [Kwoniella heveanensis BCC8398]